MSLFSNNEELHTKQKYLLRIMIGCHLIEICRLLINGILRTIGSEKIVTIYMAIIYLIFNLTFSNFAIRKVGISGIFFTMGLCNLMAYISGILCFIYIDLDKNIKKIFCKLADDKLEVIQEEEEADESIEKKEY
jgi:Na+-driven multidrug efflux pump